MTGYTAHYWFERINDEDGFAYECLHNGRVIFEGWCRGKKREAEHEVRRGIDNREMLLAASDEQKAS